MTKIACVLLLKLYLDYRRNKVKTIAKGTIKYKRFMEGH
jgi:hypothetical protein